MNYCIYIWSVTNLNPYPPRLRHIMPSIFAIFGLTLVPCWTNSTVPRWHCTVHLSGRFLRISLHVDSNAIVLGWRLMQIFTIILKSFPAVDLDLAVRLCQWPTLVEWFKWLGAFQRLPWAGFYFLLCASPTLFTVTDKACLTVNSATNSAAFFTTVEGLFCELRKTHAFAHLIWGLVYFFLNWLFSWLLARCLLF